MANPGTSDKVEVPPDGFLRKTGQLWKLVVGGIVVPIPLALMAYVLLRRIGQEQSDSEVVLTMGALVAGALCIVALFASVRCPRCKVRLVPQLLRAPDGAKSLVTFLGLYSCPACGFEPRREPGGGKQPEAETDGNAIS